MASTLEDLQAIEEALRLGARVVRYADRQIEYRTLEEIRSIRDEIKRELGLVDTGKKPRRRVWIHNRGT